MNNAFKTLADILNNKTLQVAKIISYNGIYYSAQLSSGNIINVKSENQYSTDDNVFIENDRITGKAPNRTLIEIELGG